MPRSDTRILTRRSRFVPVAAGILLALALGSAGDAAADRLGSSDVTYYPAGPSEVSLRLRESLTYPWVFYNGGTGAAYLNLTANGAAFGVLGRASPTFLLLRPADWGQIDLVLTAPDHGPARTGSVRVHLTATDLVTNATGVQDVFLPVAILGVSPANDPTGKILGFWANPFPAPFNNRVAAFAVSVGIWAGFAAALVFVVDPVVKRFARRTATHVDDIILSILRGPVFVLVLLFGTVNSLAILGLPLAWQDLLLHVYGFVLALLLTWVAYRVFRNVLVQYGKQLSRRTHSELDDRLVPALEKLGGLVIIILGIVLAVQSLGYDITLFLAGLGVLGLVVAFAAQDTLSNFFAGIHIMLDRPFRVGDLIEIEPDVVCRVQDIGLRSTKLYWGKSHDLIVMPNKELAGRKIINYVRPDRRFVINVKIGVSYRSDLDRVRKAMTEVALAHQWVLKDPGKAPIWRVVDFTDSAIIVMIIVWVDDVDHNWQLSSDLREQIKRRFDAESIEIPFPQRVVELKDGRPPRAQAGETP